MWFQDRASRQGARHPVGRPRAPLGAQWLLADKLILGAQNQNHKAVVRERLSLQTLTPCFTWTQAAVPGSSQGAAVTSPTPSRAKMDSCLTLRKEAPEGGGRTLMKDDATAHEDKPSSRLLMVPPGGPGPSCQGTGHSGPVASTDLFVLFP